MSVYSLTRSFQIQAWVNWLEEKWVCGEERKWILQSLVHHGLIPFINKRGYMFGCSANTLVAIIARELFLIRDGKRPRKSWNSTVLNVNYEDEEEDHYHYIMNEETWEDFWKEWGYLFDEDCIKERFIVQHAVWTCLDLEKSPQTAELYESYDTEVEEPTGFKPRVGANDPYLIDMAEGYQDKFY